MATVTGNRSLSVSFAQSLSSGLITPQNLPASVSLNSAYINGTGAASVDLIHAKQYTLAGAATEIDLQAIADLSGATVNMARVRELVVQVVTATAGYDVTLGNAAANAWAALWGATGTSKVFAGSTYYWSDPTSTSTRGGVTSGTSRVLKLDPGANTVVVNVLIVGCSA